MERPEWMKRLASKEDLERVRKAVVAVERRTSAEIVPMIVHSSISTGHVMPLLFLIHFVFFWVLVSTVAPLLAAPIWALELGAFAVSAVAAWLQKDLDVWKRWLTSASDQDLSVQRRAQLEFYQSGIKATAGGTGVLIFVSRLEHEAVLLADQAISERLPPETWNKILAELIGHIKQGDFPGGMCSAIAQVGELLAQHFPVQERDINELADLLIIKE